MTGTSHQAVHAAPEVPKPPAPHSARPEARSWLLRLLDSFLSESLRSGSPSELVRSRVLVGSTLFLLVFDLSYVLAVPVSPATIVASIVALGWAVVLVIARKARSHTSPAVLLCTSNVLGFLTALFPPPGPTLASIRDTCWSPPSPCT